MKHLKPLFTISILLWCCLNSCEPTKQPADGVAEASFYPNSKPGVRWWWFATEIKKEDIKYQLNWLKEKEFGGVEIAWVYPLYRYQKMYRKKYGRNYPKDTTAVEWLSPAWADAVAYTKRYADSIGLYCDFTFGSAWPVAGHNIDKQNTTQIYGDSSFRQTLTFSWAWPDTFLVVNHLDNEAFKTFALPITKALKPALKGSKSALFTDSWEIKLNGKNKIWTVGFEEKFKENFGYDIIPYMEEGLDSFPDVRYDYMLQLDQMVTDGFYKPYVNTCKRLGAWSRVQCLASPTDVMTTYGLVDIPETESMLNNPNYSRIVSSAAALSSKRVVSSESFTCMYGFPATYLREEQIADLKMVADAMFANGVNHHFYHGFPYNPEGSDTVDFFATTYFGPGGSLEPELEEFNKYISKVSSYLQEGETYTDVAVYIPYEDGVMKGAYPKERQRVWVWGEYEMRYIDPPKELEGYHPLWINRYFLEQAKVEDGKLNVGDASFKSLYIDVDYMDIRSLRKIVEHAQNGLRIILKKDPMQAGMNKSEDYRRLISQLKQFENVSPEIGIIHQDLPLLVGDSLPAYWCKRLDDGSYLLFLAQTKSKDLKYPIYSGQSLEKDNYPLNLQLNFDGMSIDLDLSVKPYQSILLKCNTDGKYELLDIEYNPPNPNVKPKEKQRMYF